jgi:hypothetical protein
MGAVEQVNQLLKDSGAELVRDHKHEVWRLPNGANFIRSKTPSDGNTGYADLTTLRRALGVENKGKGEGERRVKRVKGRKALPTAGAERTPAMRGGLAEQLEQSGIVAMAEVEKAKHWAGRWKRSACFHRSVVIRHAAEIERLRSELSKPCACLWCKVKKLLT